MSSGKHRTREAEVVSTPQDFTIRYDNKNTRRFERQLRAALTVLRVSGLDVLVGWRQDAVRFGLDLTVISELAKIIAVTAPPDGHRHLRGVEIYTYSPEVARQVDYFRVRRCSSATLAVHSSLSLLGADGRKVGSGSGCKKGSNLPCGVVLEISDL